MIAHNREGQAIDRKNRGQKLKSIGNPLSTVFVRISRNGIFAAQKSSADAATDGMNNLNRLRVKVFTASKPGHEVATTGRIYWVYVVTCS